MKLFRHGEPGKEKPGVIWNNKTYDLAEQPFDFNEKFFESNGLSELKENLKINSYSELKDIRRFGSPVQRPSKIICIGLNYSDHAKESNMELPKEPVIFFKATTALSGPNDNLVIPRGSEKTDWEVELAIVIGKKAKHASESEAMNCVAGFCVHNDYSERAFQLERGGQWVKGKSCDTFAPIGPYLVTPDEIPDINKLKMRLTVNGVEMQNGSTSTMIYKPAYLVSYVSQFMTLLPGDVISTGTPAGVGMGKKPPVYLKPGDVIELSIDGLGKQRQVAVQG
jgi:2-keto-4-pentenoate hydratase/2-oxohepta-3-ene-1,7-dioic acid hydratase in catechol pathway